MLPRFALVVLGLLVLVIVGLGIYSYSGGPFAIWKRQMVAGRTYMKSLRESDMPAWIERSKHLLAEYRADVGPVGVYDDVTHGKPIPSDLARLKIVRVDIFQDAVCYVWMGGMDHTYLEARRLKDGSITLVAHYNDYESEVIWPKRPNQTMERIPKAFGVAQLVDSLVPLVQPSGLRSMSRLDSAGSRHPHPPGFAHLCPSLPSGSIASPLHSR